MRTEHAVYVDDSRDLQQLHDDSVELVVTSPPYPMIEMWDSVFGELNPEITDHLEDQAGRAAFELMHAELDKTWADVSRVLVDGGTACINVGDATRKLDGSFRVYQNHARIIEAFEQLGFEPLPDILWRKPVNSGTKFMGSGMLPPNAYATLEHEYLLIFRNGPDRRSFAPKSDRRYESAYFWEERNEWFSDVWTDVRGELQGLPRDELRERSAAYPVEIPYRLINMFSVYGDTVLDPFWGTGTTSMAAMTAARHSIGYEREADFTTLFHDRISDIESMSKGIVHDRLERHRAFVEARQEENDDLTYTSEQYDFPVMTTQEQQILFYVVDGVHQVEDGYRVSHSPYHPGDGGPATADTQSTLADDYS